MILQDYARMSELVKKSDVIVTSAAPLPMASLLSATGIANPAYLVVSALDRNAYAAGASGAVGAFAGNGQGLALTDTGGVRSAGIVFTWQAGHYVNAVYGNLLALEFVPSVSAGDVTNISIFATSSLALAVQDAQNPLTLLRADPAGYIGSSTIVTDAKPFVPAGGNVTPDKIAACAESFVGRAWNDLGCWNLASTIAAEAGAGLPLSATALGVPGRGNGAWVVVYSGPSHASFAWSSLVRAGDVITFGTPGGGGHITTCVSGSGASAMLIDNITFQNAVGQITNAAHDGAPGDILIAAPHPASQEWAGVQANSVVIYALDTPVVTANVAAPIALRATIGLSALASISDPGGRAITQIQVTESGSAAALRLNGHTVAGGSIAAPVNAASLAALSVMAGTAGGTVMLDIRAFNGAYWGDWQSETVQIGNAGSMALVAGLSVTAAFVHASGMMIDWLPGELGGPLTPYDMRDNSAGPAIGSGAGGFPMRPDILALAQPHMLQAAGAGSWVQ
jgi:hypothetical protein